MDRRRFLATGAILGLGGCFLPSQYDPFAPGVTVVIENAAGATADVYLVRDGGRQRLGQIRNGEVERFLVSWREGRFAIRVQLPQQPAMARSISARPGEIFRYRLEDRNFIRVGEE